MEAFRARGQRPALPTDVVAGGTYTVEGEVDSALCTGEFGWVDLTATPVGRKFRVQVLGEPEGKPNLLFLVGALNDMAKPSTLSALTGMFANSFRVVSFDGRNSGETRPFTWEEAREPGDTEYSHVAEYADDAAAVAAVIFGPQARYHVAGFSAGAVQALWVAYRYPLRVKGIANICGGYYPSRMDEFADGGFDDLDRLCGDEVVWVRAMMESNNEVVALHANTTLKKDSPQLKATLLAMEEENERLYATEGYDKAGVMRGIRHLQVAGRICGCPPKEYLRQMSMKTYLVGGRWDKMHKLSRMRELKKLMPDSKLMMHNSAHFQTTIFSCDEITKFFKSLE